jgi:hypothetical protein
MGSGFVPEPGCRVEIVLGLTDVSRCFALALLPSPSPNLTLITITIHYD